MTADDRVLAMASQAGTLHPRITVITPAYNVEKYIGEAMDSVLSQTFRDFEYLVVDDGSSDGTVAEVRSRMPSDLRLRLIMANHGGSGSARNAGVAAAGVNSSRSSMVMIGGIRISWTGSWRYWSRLAARWRRSSPGPG